MAEKGLIKIADKKDESYNVVPEKVGPEGFDDKTGYELTELAHPDQIQVAHSQLEDGIVENGVERQKIMVDVARRNPRGVLAELMKTLVKAANVLEADLTSESLKMAAEVDALLIVLAQSQVVLNPEAAKTLDAIRVTRLKKAATEAISRFNDLDWHELPGQNYTGFASLFMDKKNDESGAGSGYTDQQYAESVVNSANKKLKEFLDSKDDVNIASNKIAQYINQFYKMVNLAIKHSTDLGRDQDEAVVAWAALKTESDEWLARGNEAQKDRAPATEQLVPGLMSKAPSKLAPTHHYFAVGPEVKELQGLIGVSDDGKFGPKTFAALKEAAKNNTLLANFFEENPKLDSGYQAWNNSSVGEAILRIRQSDKTTLSKNDELLPSPYTKEYEEGFRAGKDKLSALYPEYKPRTSNK